MKAFRWGHVFETGLKEVDDQHKALVDLINRLGQEFTENDVRSENSDNILQELPAYAQKHFEDEEEMMGRLQLDSRHVNLHVLEHSEFLDDVLVMIEQLHARSLSDYTLFPHICVIFKKSMLAGKRRLRYQLYGSA